MSGISVEIVDNSEDIKRATREQIAIALEKCGLVAEGYAKLECPVDTGRLRGSISYEVGDSEVEIGTNVEYAAYVEYGTGQKSTIGGQQTISGQRPHPYLKPALTNNINEYKQIIENTLKQ